MHKKKTEIVYKAASLHQFLLWLCLREPSVLRWVLSKLYWLTHRRTFLTDKLNHYYFL